MQKAIRRFLSATAVLDTAPPDEVGRLVLEFWIAVETVLPSQWRDSRRHFLTKGVGVYALMGILVDLCRESAKTPFEMTRVRFAELLDDFAPAFDWSNDGPLKGLGGESGAQEALSILRRAREASRPLSLTNG